MRRSDREVTDIDEILGVIGRASVCRLAMADEPFPYIVPMSFGFRYDGVLTLYFHSAREGRKIGLLRENPNAGFELDSELGLIESGTACEYSVRYESVVGCGTVAFLTSREEKERALAILMNHYAPGGNFQFSERQVDAVEVFKLTAKRFSCKRRS